MTIVARARIRSTLSLSLAPAWRAIFEPSIAVAEVRDADAPRVLDEAARSRFAKASDRRRHEYAAGRACATRALADLGASEQRVGVGPGRAPLWPGGFTGSITHTGTYAAAAVGRAEAWAGIGLDAELEGAVSWDVRREVLTVREQLALAGFAPPERDRSLSVMFSAKEAFYKAQSGLGREWIGFEEVEVEISGETWTLRPAGRLALAHIRWPVQGRYRVTSGLVLAGVALPSLVEAASAPQADHASPAAGPDMTRNGQ